MLNDVIHDPKMERYRIRFEKNSVIFVEGDDSQDLFILVSGHLDVLKGNKKIAEIVEPGAFFGEMSFLLGAKRTATVKAANAVETIRIPKKEITRFLVDFPEVSREITKLLARRLDETSQILFGLKEVCDQLPDAVIVTDSEGKIISWNVAAEKLYGRKSDEMRRMTVEDIYEDPESYQSVLKEIQSERSIREKVLKIRHPEKGTRYISTSTTFLYGGHHDFQGILSLGRDVTAVETLQHRYRRVRFWLIPAVLLLLCLAATVFYGYPYFSKGVHTLDTRKVELRNQMGKDFLLLKSLLNETVKGKSAMSIRRSIKDFQAIQETAALPYTGIVLLDSKKKVLAAFSFKTGTDSMKHVGTSYAGIEFQGRDDSIHRVLTLYRTSREHPMGKKSVEIAFRIDQNGQLLGWLVFQMDMDLLAREFEIDETDLKRFRFSRSNE